MSDPFLAHSEISNEIYIICGKKKYPVTEQVISAMKATGRLNERPTGHWIEHYDSSDGFTWLTCSRCMCKAYEDDYNFCPNCGAEMGKEAEND